MIVRGANITKCPHCGGKCKTLKSDQVTPTYREITYMCTTDTCKYMFVAGIEPIRTLSKSANPNPNVHIPDSRRAAS